MRPIPEMLSYPEHSPTGTEKTSMSVDFRMRSLPATAISPCRKQKPNGACWRRFLRAIMNCTDCPVFIRKDGAWTLAGANGFLIPVRNKDGLIQGMKIRLDDDAARKIPLAVQPVKPHGKRRPQLFVDTRHRRHHAEARLSHRGAAQGRYCKLFCK